MSLKDDVKYYKRMKEIQDKEIKLLRDELNNLKQALFNITSEVYDKALNDIRRAKACANRVRKKGGKR